MAPLHLGPPSQKCLISLSGTRISHTGQGAKDSCWGCPRGTLTLGAGRAVCWLGPGYRGVGHWVSVMSLRVPTQFWGDSCGACPFVLQPSRMLSSTPLLSLDFSTALVLESVPGGTGQKPSRFVPFPTPGCLVKAAVAPGGRAGHDCGC